MFHFNLEALPPTGGLSAESALPSVGPGRISTAIADHGDNGRAIDWRIDSGSGKVFDVTLSHGGLATLIGQIKLSTLDEANWSRILRTEPLFRRFKRVML